MVSSFEAAASLGAGPAVAMLAFSLLGLGISPPKNLAGAMQHFAAGILLSAVAQELVPPMAKAQGVHENVAVVIGFSLGVLVMLLLGVLMPEAELEEDEEEEDKPMNTIQSSSTAPKPGLGRRSTSRIMGGEKAAGRCSAVVSVPSGQATLLDKPPTPSFPVSFLTAVIIDGAMDGLLLGIASAASESAGLVLAVSLAIEMGFLGLTLATSMKGQPKAKALLGVLAPPAAIIVMAAIGGFGAGLLATEAAFKVGLLSFGCSALIYMVAEELLLEAHESGGAHVWWVDMMLYVGFLSSIYLSKLVQ